MFAIVYYDGKIEKNVIVMASSVFEIVYKKYEEKYKNNKVHNYRITVM